MGQFSMEITRPNGSLLGGTQQIALNRKNALFAGHDEGGAAWGRIASLIETCKINGIEPFAYLKATLTAIANGHPQSRLDDLLPWNFTPSR